MSFIVQTYNTDSGWKLADTFSDAATEAEAIAEVADKLGVKGLLQFRHVATEVEAENVVPPAEQESSAQAEVPVAPEAEAAPAPEAATPVAAPVEAAAPFVEELPSAEDEILSVLRDTPGLLEKLLQKLNRPVGG